MVEDGPGRLRRRDVQSTMTIRPGRFRWYSSFGDHALEHAAVDQRAIEQRACTPAVRAIAQWAPAAAATRPACKGHVLKQARPRVRNQFVMHRAPGAMPYLPGASRQLALAHGVGIEPPRVSWRLFGLSQASTVAA